eukprot:SAG31_NODE_6457_length_2002_cov_0.821130_1_plen_55_part_00
MAGLTCVSSVLSSSMSAGMGLSPPASADDILYSRPRRTFRGQRATCLGGAKSPP